MGAVALTKGLCLVAAGKPRSDFDTIIAAHAMWRGVPLVTLDGNFDGIPGLIVERA